MKNVVPLEAPDGFARIGIDWNRAATTEGERQLREAFLTHEISCGTSGLVSVLLLAATCRRKGTVADDLQNAADFAEIILSMELRKHQDDALAGAQAYVEAGGPAWS
jgi:hypothetical protein